MNKLFLCLLSCQLSSFVLSQFDAYSCSAYDNSCQDCISAPGCQWCMKRLNRFSAMNSLSLTIVKSNCFLGTVVVTTSDSAEVNFYENNDSQHCIRSFETCSGVSENPINRVVSSQSDNLPLSGNDERSPDKAAIQISPQNVRLQLRVGTPQNTTLHYKRVKDYPVDLYYLMDLSKSMEDDKANLANLGRRLAKTMMNLTSEFRLGFGSFVDKVLLPFTDIHPAKLQNPCSGCASPYSFRNDLKLYSVNENNINVFVDAVNNAKISGNLDAPEGGFDALMQAMVCTDEIGWRDHATRLLVMSTDAEFHSAGDGKLAGIITPNDEQCHLDGNGYYNEYAKYDYPSVGQINKVAKENRINIIFAASRQSELYEKLSERIELSSFGELDSNSANVIELVRQQYYSITSKIILRDNAEGLNNFVSFRYFSDCDSPQPLVFQETNVCQNVKEGDFFTYKVEAQLNKCPDSPIVSTLTTTHDFVNVYIEPLCKCACEAPGHPEREANSALCSHAGTLQCEVCSCNPGKTGNICQCSQDATRNTTVGEDLNKCQREGDDKLCSGRGKCECGICLCNPGYTGSHCQCDQGRCKITKDQLCSGRGDCRCDICACIPGWHGRYCECPDESSCKAPKGNGKVCSGHGKCECGACSCDVEGDIPYSGRYCEDCPTCASGKCIEFRDCIQCKIFDSGKLEGQACLNCSLTPFVLHSLDEELLEGANQCVFIDESTGCEFNFTYKYVGPGYGNDYRIVVQEKQKCPAEVDAFGITFGLIGAIVAVGLLTLLIWKVVTVIHDRREFARFESERMKAKWQTGGNPIYKPVESEFQNPTFSDKK